MTNNLTPEQRARDMLERLDHPDAQSLSAGEVVELANLIAENEQLRSDISQAYDLRYKAEGRYCTALREIERLRGEAEVADEQLAQLRGFAEAHKNCRGSDEPSPHAGYRCLNCGADLSQHPTAASAHVCSG